jgi:hypothetical protein
MSKNMNQFPIIFFLGKSIKKGPENFSERKSEKRKKKIPSE